MCRFEKSPNPKIPFLESPFTTQGSLIHHNAFALEMQKFPCQEHTFYVLNVIFAQSYHFVVVITPNNALNMQTTFIQACQVDRFDKKCTMSRPMEYGRKHPLHPVSFR